MPNPAFDVSYRAVSAFYRVASAAPSGARLYHQYAKKLGGNSFLVLFRAHIEEALSKAATPSVFVVNMSGFGAVNESYGHDGGNQFLEKAEAHIYQFFKAQGMDVAVSRSGINFVVVAKGLRSDLAKKTLTDLQAYLGAPERSYKVKVAAKYVTRDGGVRGEVQNRFLGEKGNYDVELRKAPLFNGRKRKRVNFPSFYVGLLEGEKNLSSASYQEAVEKVITSVNVRSNDPTQPKVHTYQIANLVEPEEG
ncbi:MAG: diguanylate cyclase, partial [Candidatus Saganbacteria bacterium]|nr:diguanylate cyclase [Candidatus Saganbacteria bacterium]